MADSLSGTTSYQQVLGRVLGWDIKFTGECGGCHACPHRDWNSIVLGVWGLPRQESLNYIGFSLMSVNCLLNITHVHASLGCSKSWLLSCKMNMVVGLWCVFRGPVVCGWSLMMSELLNLPVVSRPDSHLAVDLHPQGPPTEDCREIHKRFE